MPLTTTSCHRTSRDISLFLCEFLKVAAVSLRNTSGKKSRRATSPVYPTKNWSSTTSSYTTPTGTRNWTAWRYSKPSCTPRTRTIARRSGTSCSPRRALRNQTTSSFILSVSSRNYVEQISFRSALCLFFTHPHHFFFIVNHRSLDFRSQFYIFPFAIEPFERVHLTLSTVLFTVPFKCLCCNSNS